MIMRVESVVDTMGVGDCFLGVLMVGFATVKAGRRV